MQKAYRKENRDNYRNYSRGWSPELLIVKFAALLLAWLFLRSCIISPQDLECRPCAPQNYCGEFFVCIKGVCRPRNSKEYKRCERFLREKSKE